MNVQTGFNQYKAVTYMQSYSSKPEDECSLSMRQKAAAFEEKLDYLPMRKLFGFVLTTENAPFKKMFIIFYIYQRHSLVFLLLITIFQVEFTLLYCYIKNFW